jgi:rhodanese-related sulfurtransferase
MKAYLPLLYTIIYLALFVFPACTQSKTENTTLEPKEFNEQLQSQQGVLLDVRTPEEFNEGHLADAQNIDFKNTSFEASMGQLDKNKTYFVYCKAGIRSEKAVDLMQKLGFKQVYHMQGGIDAWKKEGLPLQN